MMIGRQDVLDEGEGVLCRVVVLVIVYEQESEQATTLVGDAHLKCWQADRKHPGHEGVQALGVILLIHDEVVESQELSPAADEAVGIVGLDVIDDEQVGLARAVSASFSNFSSRIGWLSARNFLRGICMRFW